jgi:hypothetical protein
MRPAVAWVSLRCAQGRLCSQTSQERDVPAIAGRMPALHQNRECESRLFEGWRETTHWREFTVNSPRAEGEFKGGRK